MTFGRPDAARRHFERALALFDPTEHRGLALDYAYDQRVVPRDLLSSTLYVQGYPEQAEAQIRLSLAEAIAFWTRWNHTATKPQVSEIPDRVDDGTHVTKEVYSGGKDGTEVVVYRVEDGGHTWPGGSQYLPKMLVGKVTHQIDGSQVIWDFLRAQRLP